MNVILIGSLIISKIFYISIWSVGEFNFTLSDVCYIAFLTRMLIDFFTAKDLRDTYESEIYDHLRRMLIFAVGALVLNVATTVAAGAVPIRSILHIFKRWTSMVIIPFYFCRCVRGKERVVWMCITVMLFYAVTHYQSIILENATRYYAEGAFNPNILGALFGLILIYVINSKYRMSIKIFVSFVSVFMIFACSTRGAVLAVIATILIQKFFVADGENILERLKTVLIFTVLAAIGVYFLAKLIPAATERLTASFRGGITNEVSYISRVKIAKQSIAACIYNPRLMLFGTGFGTVNQALILRRYGYNIGTSDNMYIDMLCWVGAIGMPFVYFYLRDLMTLSYDVGKYGYSTALAITIYMFCLGFTQSAIFEPTVGGIYYILLSFDMIRAMDIEEARRRSEIDAEEKTDA